MDQYLDKDKFLRDYVFGTDFEREFNESINREQTEEEIIENNPVVVSRFSLNMNNEELYDHIESKRHNIKFEINFEYEDYNEVEQHMIDSVKNNILIGKSKMRDKKREFKRNFKEKEEKKIHNRNSR